MLLTMGYSLLQWVLGVGCCLVLHLPGVEAGALLRDLLVLAASNLCVYIAVLPVAALSASLPAGMRPARCSRFFTASVLSLWRAALSLPSIPSAPAPCCWPGEQCPRPAPASLCLTEPGGHAGGGGDSHRHGTGPSDTAQTFGPAPKGQRPKAVRRRANECIFHPDKPNVCASFKKNRSTAAPFSAVLLL